LTNPTPLLPVNKSTILSQKSSQQFQLLNKRSTPNIADPIDDMVEFNDSDLEINFDDYLYKRELKQKQIYNSSNMVERFKNGKVKKTRKRDKFKKKVDLGSNSILENILPENRRKILKTLDKLKNNDLNKKIVSVNFEEDLTRKMAKLTEENLLKASNCDSVVQNIDNLIEYAGESAKNSDK
jgi:hypothetical protein